MQVENGKPRLKTELESGVEKNLIEKMLKNVRAERREGEIFKTALN